MKTITIDTAALATIVQELASETITGVGTLFLNGRADGVASLHRRLLQFARTPAPATSLAGHEDVVGPVAWRHCLPAGQTFLGGRESQVVENMQEALGHMDRFGGHLVPLFQLASVGDSSTWKREGSTPQLQQAVGRGRRQPEAFDLASGRPVIQNIGAAIDAAAADAAAAGYPDANKPANEGGFARPATLVLITAMALVLFVLTRSAPVEVEQVPVPTPGANVQYAPYVFTDDTTGCQYLSTHSSTGLAPRIAADGKSHAGCKGGAQ